MKRVKRRILKNKPLVEAIFELRWGLQEGATPEIKIDPHYKLLIGRIFDRVKQEYPFPEQLPTAIMPDEVAAYLIQHRFRKDKDKWPLIQVGPGIITVNDTDGYVWEDFKKRINRVLRTFFVAYPDAKNLNINGLLLRYIDAIPLDMIKSDFKKDSIFAFMKEQMKTEIKLDPRLFEDIGVNKLPSAFDLRFSFPCTRPKGAISLRFVRAKWKESDVLLWETIVQSSEDMPKSWQGISLWLTKAHYLTDYWFFKIIEGDLLERFL